MSANQALFVPELLLEVFRSIDRDSADESNPRSKAGAKANLSRCVLVCKAWKEPATDVLWQSIPSALCLLSILGPMTYLQDQEDTGWVFVDTVPNPDLVHRLDRLRGRILTLAHYDKGKWGGIYRSTIAKAAMSFVMSAIAKLPDSGAVYLLPRVRRITWESFRPSHSSPLAYMVAPSTTYLSIHPCLGFRLPGFDNEREIAACRALLGTMIAIPCRLETFHFTYSVGSMPQRLEEDMVHFLSAQRSLESTGLHFPLTAALIEGLEASAHTLRSLETSIQLEETDLEVIEISDLIATSFPRLENLSLRLLDSIDSDPEVSMSSFDSLLKLNSLRSFTIHSKEQPITPLQAEEIEAMGKGWPVLERLVFAAWPTEPSFSVAPISILSVLAQHLGHSLIHLFIDMECIDVPSPEVREDVRFTRLRSLEIGRSTTIERGSERAVADYLGSLCPKNLKIRDRCRREVWALTEPMTLLLESWDVVARILNDGPEPASVSL